MPSRALTVHGTLVDMYGLGVLFTGASGIGKTTLAQALVARDHFLVADDVTLILKKENFLYGFAPRALRGKWGTTEQGTHLFRTENRTKKIAKISIICHLISSSSLLQLPFKAPTMHYHSILGLPIQEVLCPRLTTSKQTAKIESIIKNHMKTYKP